MSERTKLEDLQAAKNLMNGAAARIDEAASLIGERLPGHRPGVNRLVASIDELIDILVTRLDIEIDADKKMETA